MAALDAMLACREVESLPSGEMVAPVIQCLLLDQPGSFPLNVPNDGQVADLPLGATVESMCLVSANGVRGRDSVALPAPLAECLRRVSASQELTVDAAMSGDRDAAFAAMLLDPLTEPARLRRHRGHDRRDARRHRGVAAAVLEAVSARH